VSSYVSIPVELSCSLINEDDFGLYLKGGATANINVYSATKFVVDTSASVDARQRLTSYFTNVEPFFVTAHAKVGMRFGSYDFPNVRVEFGIPFMLSKGNTIRYRMSSGITAQITLYIPLFIFFT
jgi:hypothetical protein